MVGFILDRTGTTPKIKMDGSNDVVDLELDNVKTADHSDYVNKKANVFVRLESSGRVTFVRGNASMIMKRDADSPSLTGGPPSVSPPAPGPGDVPNRRLGHYSSGDGLMGFVLDRTGQKPRMRMDGTAEIVEMDAEPAGDDTSLTVHRRGVVMRLGTHGEVTYFRGNDAITMRRDADAEPLR